jgi:Tol biopolymer transport system component
MHVRTLLSCSLALALSACAAPKTSVSVDLLEVRPTEGLELTVVRKPTLAYLETIERSPHASAVSRVTANGDSAVQISAPMISPKEDLLVFTEIIQEDSGTTYSNIFKLVPGNAAKTSVTFGKWLDSDPSFTPDGQHLVFGSNRTSQYRSLWRVPLGREGGLTKLTGSHADDSFPSVSPSGSSVIYASVPRYEDDMQVWALEAGFQTQLREGGQPQISPDGKHIVFVRYDKTSKANPKQVKSISQKRPIPGRMQLWAMNDEGGEETQLTANLDYDACDPRWSPDGQWIVFASDEGLDSERRHNFDIWAMRPDGTGKTQLTTNGSLDDNPCWDRSGRFIYFRSNRGGTWNIWRFEPRL